MITGAAPLEHGTSPATAVACPAVTVAARRTIHNDGDFARDAEGNALAEASIGQGSVQATTLDMAADDGTYRSPRIVPTRLAGHRTTRRLPRAVTAGLRAMMGDVVRYGTAAHAGLPAGTHGKTGTAEYGSGGRTHACSSATEATSRSPSSSNAEVREGASRRPSPHGSSP